MSEEQKAQEDKVFDQELSVDDLDAAGGFCSLDFIIYGPRDTNRNNCSNNWYRPLYGGNGFPNCAATVEEGSNCKGNDGCYDFTVVYEGKQTDCGRAWR